MVLRRLCRWSIAGARRPICTTAITLCQAPRALDGQDVYELAVAAMKDAHGLEKDGEIPPSVKDALALAESQMSNLSAMQCAQLATASIWPIHWAWTAPYSKLFDFIRLKIHDDAPGLNGHDAAVIVVMLCADDVSSCFFKCLNAYQAEATKGRAVAPGTYRAAYFLRLLKVVMHHVNDIKETALLLNLCAAVRHLSRNPTFRPPEGFWDLMRRRLDAHERMFKLKPHQAFRAIQYLAPNCKDSSTIYPFVQAIVRGAQVSLLQHPDEPTPSSWKDVCNTIRGHLQLGVRDFLQLLHSTAAELPREHFRVFYPLNNHFLVPLITYCSSEVLKELVFCFTKANVRNDVLLTSIMGRCVELGELREQVRNRGPSSAPLADGEEESDKQVFLGEVEVRDVVRLLDLLSVSPHMANDETGVTPRFIGYAVLRIQQVCDEANPNHMLHVCDSCYRIIRYHRERIQKHKMSTADDANDSGSIAGDLVKERAETLVIQPLLELVSRFYARRFLKFLENDLCSVAVVEKFLDRTAPLGLSNDPTVVAIRDLVSARLKKKSGDTSVQLPPLPSSGTRHLFSDISGPCFMMAATASELPPPHRERLRVLLNQYPAADVLFTIHLRYTLSNPELDVKKVHRPPIIPMPLARLMVMRIVRDAENIAASINGPSFSVKRCRRFVQAMSTVLGECDVVGPALKEIRPLMGLYEILLQKLNAQLNPDLEAQESEVQSSGASSEA